MEVKEPSARYLAQPAYQQTEIGLIPEDWLLIPIGSFVTEFRGGAPLRPSDFTSTGVKVLPKGGVGRTGWLQIDDRDQQFCLPVFADAHSSNQVDESFAIVVLRDLVPSGPSIGLMVQIREPGHFVLAQGVYGFRVKDHISPKYLVHLSNTNWYRKLANSVMVGSTQVHITNSAFKAVVLPIPSLFEQQAIAEALSDADALIESLEQLLAKKRQIKQGAMQELLTGQKRLPGFAEEWKPTSLGLIGEFFKGSGITRDEAQSGTLPCVRYGEIYTTHNDYIRAFQSWISVEVAASATRLRQGDVLFAGSGETKEEIGKCIAFVDDVEAYAGGDIVILRPRGFDSLFLGYALNTAEVNRQKASRGQGDAVVHISATTLAQIEVHIPDIAEQTAIATLLSDMDAELAALDARLAKARDLKQGMMQELLTGRIRLV